MPTPSATQPLLQAAPGKRIALPIRVEPKVADRIRKRLPGPYDDRFGPTVLCVFILAAILINFGLRFGDKGV
ncbi:hypothetical protein BGZ95_012065 [Linnemannia exigua]|uniref:Uncharacterized protein n=1 Tax=Linnemannia exigua TaxID=604196 RepID=A0AAD4H4Q5_9FUNG|nr:hypothetical protein BGZ95_012065 [Linnemannia exigua]